MKSQRKNLALVLALLFTLTAVVVPLTSAGAEKYVPPYFLDRFDETSLDLTQFWGKAYMLFFFTESSPECAKQIGEIKKIYENYSSDDLQIIMIHEWANETDTATLKVIAEHGLENLTGLYFHEDSDMSIAKKINIPGCPFTIFMNDGGYLFDGIYRSLSYDIMASALDAMNVSKGSPATPAPEATLAPVATEAAATAEPAAAATAAPTAAPKEEAPSGGVPFGAIGAVDMP